MTGHSRTTNSGLSKSSRPTPRTTIAAFLCSKRGITISIVISLVIYFFIFRWSASQHPGTLNLEQSHQKVGKSVVAKTLDPIDREFEDRRKLYEQRCVYRRESTDVWELFLHAPSKLSVCHVPKAGCTFWKRLFRYLNSEHERSDISSLFDIDRIQAHYGPPSSLPTYDYNSPEGRILVDASTKVLMARSPYKRLWSAYVDKFVLPEWWLDHGRSIMFARKELSRQKSCPDDISFEEFLEYSLRNHDHHWRPISEVCDPCTYRPKYVGHVDETFTRDVRHILSTLGLHSLLSGYEDDRDRLPDDIENLIDYHFQWYQQREQVRDCLSESDLAELLWRALRLNGYYKMDHVFPLEKVKSAVKDATPKKVRDAVVEIFLEEFRRSPTTVQAWREQREAVFLESYRNVSEVTKVKIMKRYYDDFDMFGFDINFPGGSDKQ